ncbi:hypothetical protein BJ508DRAFT_164333 [Ascobolus immersus RN42]|uniref:Uncharacterized protein n=1 Tax=Ascobolus immersus RN42 TaxID=1160509 RepID=A0A3N4HVQ2_ASCIM|nr:hypothetical protein BJ508DRAFT_164333 [Ascobolus immersus RN42]
MVLNIKYDYPPSSISDSSDTGSDNYENSNRLRTPSQSDEAFTSVAFVSARAGCWLPMGPADWIAHEAMLPFAYAGSEKELQGPLELCSNYRRVYGPRGDNGEYTGKRTGNGTGRMDGKHYDFFSMTFPDGSKRLVWAMMDEYDWSVYFCTHFYVGVPTPLKCFNRIPYFFKVEIQNHDESKKHVFFCRKHNHALSLARKLVLMPRTKGADSWVSYQFERMENEAEDEDGLSQNEGDFAWQFLGFDKMEEEQNRGAVLADKIQGSRKSYNRDKYAFETWETQVYINQQYGRSPSGHCTRTSRTTATGTNISDCDQERRRCAYLNGPIIFQAHIRAQMKRNQDYAEKGSKAEEDSKVHSPIESPSGSQSASQKPEIVVTAPLSDLSPNPERNQTKKVEQYQDSTAAITSSQETGKDQNVPTESDSKPVVDGVQSQLNHPVIEFMQREFSTNIEYIEGDMDLSYEGLSVDQQRFGCFYLTSPIATTPNRIGAFIDQSLSVQEAMDFVDYTSEFEWDDDSSDKDSC